MSQGELSRVAQEKVDADGEKDVDADQDRHVHEIRVFHDERVKNGGQKTEEQDHLILFHRVCPTFP